MGTPKWPVAIRHLRVRPQLNVYPTINVSEECAVLDVPMIRDVSPIHDVSMERVAQFVTAMLTAIEAPSVLTVSAK